MKKLSGRRAVVVDAHPLWLDGMGRLLEGVGIDIVATTQPHEVVQLVEAHGPDMLVIGLGSGATDADLLDAARAVCIAHQDIKLVLLSASADDRSIHEAFEMGATAYCMKSAEPDDLVAAVRQSFEQSIYLATSRGGQGTDHAVPRPVDADIAVEIGEEPEGPDLTKRETEILRLVAEGHSNSQVARMLWVTEQTVKFHLSNIYRKLSVANRTEASRWAQIHGLLSEQNDQVTKSAA